MMIAERLSEDLKHKLLELGVPRRLGRAVPVGVDALVGRGEAAHLLACAAKA